MKIEKVERFGREELLSRLRKTRLAGHGEPLIYADAQLTLETFDPADLVPAQRYVLAPTVEKVRELRSALRQHDIDIFELDGGVWFTDGDGERRPAVPPIVEESPADGNVLLINDGIHRVAAAKQKGAPITVVVARGLPEKYPYYALPWPGGWDAMDLLHALPESGYEKKLYREKDGYKELYRVFTTPEVLPGVQEVRTDSNPAHLRAMRST
jgi:hypothetical protein